jgi:hypothetical protein
MGMYSAALAREVAEPHWREHKDGSRLCLIHLCASLARVVHVSKTAKFPMSSTALCRL